MVLWACLSNQSLGFTTDVALRGLYFGPYAGLGSKGGLLLLAGGSVGYQHLFSEYHHVGFWRRLISMEFRGAGGLINLNFSPYDFCWISFLARANQILLD